jgi:LysR family nitrogen assimilation transcriptional regulator
MEFRTLRYFVHVADARSFSKASVILRVAQPALSRQIRKLEDEIGTPLFVRAGHHLELTEAGSLLLNRAHPLLRQVSNTIDEVRASASDLSGKLTIGVSPATGELVAPLVMRGCARRYPQLRLDFIEGFSRYVFEQLLNQGLTLCLIHNPPPHKAIEAHPLLNEAMYLVGPPPRSGGPRSGGPKSGGPKSAGRKSGGLAPVTARTSLNGLPFILPNEAHALRQSIERALGRTRLKIAAQTDGMTTTRALVAAGQGYTILPYCAIHQQLANGQVSGSRLHEIDIAWTLSLACWKDQRAARAVMAVREILAAHFASLGDDNKWGTVPDKVGKTRRKH